MAAEAVAPTGDADKDKRMQKLYVCETCLAHLPADKALTSRGPPNPHLPAFKRRLRSSRRTRHDG